MRWLSVLVIGATARLAVALVAATSVLISVMGVARASDEAPVLGAADVRLLERRGWLERDDARALRILGPYASKLTGTEGLDLADLRIARMEALECALGRVAARHLGVAQFFADAVFRGGVSSLIVLIDGQTSVALERVFDLHTIFPSTVRPTASPAGGRGREIHMLFLLAGQGKLMMAYDGAATYTHPDAAYSILGNRQYDVYPFLQMRIGMHSGRPALLDIAAADGPTARARPLEKRVLFLSPAIRSLYIDGPDVIADTSVINRKIRPPPIEWRQGTEQGRLRLLQLACPADRAWSGAERP